ncbi:UNVERIFIED_CONTAM: hypothetical protein GTU68_040064, partial [Idotea baltica]|nr:hypothetical protein [Idotea baltica]
MGEVVSLESSDAEGVAIIRLHRPKVNALNSQVGKEILEAVEQIKARDDIRAVVVWGGERIFAAGADIGEFPIDTPERDPSPFVDILNDANFALENLPQITISAVNGYALGGGCELSMSTDFRIAGEGAVFGQPEILLGIIPGAGGTQRLTRLVGVTKSKEISYSGRQVKAAEALAIGLVSEVVADDQVLARSVELAAEYAKGPAALANCKKAIMDGLHVSIEEAIAIEKREFVASFQTDDAVTGITSFLE